MKQKLVISYNDPIVKNHKAHGQELLPGLAYLDLLFQIFCDQGYEYNQLELRNLVIFSPLVVKPDSSVELTVDCEEFIRNQMWKITVSGRPFDNKNAPRTRYISADILIVPKIEFKETIDVSAVNSMKKILSFSEIYQKCRDQDLVHTGLMEADGKVFNDENADYIQVSVPESALTDAEDFMFHPTLVDGSANAAGIAMAFREQRADTEGKLFLPLSCESFKASGLIQKQCIARVKYHSIKTLPEIISWDMDFFDSRGKKLAELKALSNKLVRESWMINPEKAKPDGLTGRTFSNNDSLSTGKAGSVPNAKALVTHILGKLLNISPDDIDLQAGYYEMGLDSAMLLEVVARLEKAYKRSLAPTLLFEYTSPAKLIKHLNDSERTISPLTKYDSTDEIRKDSTSCGIAAKADEDIAIIGVAGRYPGANTIEEFWQNLTSGKDSITEIPESRWDWKIFESTETGSGRAISKWGGFINEPEDFDAQFFRISPREAKALDPQERLFLEVSWEALEDSGYTPENIVSPQGENGRKNVGVFVGVMHKDYMMIGAEAVTAGIDAPVSLNSAAIANRVSYFCDFHGPSMVMDTACSSSLTAIHQAVTSLKRGECKVAIAGGVNVALHPNKYLTYGKADMFSSEGRCKSFGEGGDGYVPGEGVGAVVLKSMSQAVRDRDHIYAVIKHSEINHGGRVSGITVPSPVAQGELIHKCCENAGINPRTITYLEAHGTGTSLGDPIEMQGLVTAFERFTSDRQFCAIGSVKSNIGHAEAAAGVSGLTKVLLQLHHRTKVPSLHAEILNSRIKFQETPFYVQQSLETWQGDILRSAISSFGATGSNAHILLESCAVDMSYEQEYNKPAVVLLSAKTAEQLKQYAGRLLNHLRNAAQKNQTGFSVHAIAHTLQSGRISLNHRLAIFASDVEELCEKLNSFLLEKTTSGVLISEDTSAVKADMLDDEDVAQLTDLWLQKGNLKKLTEFWMQGYAVTWDKLYGETGFYPEKPLKLSLPTYPFNRVCYSLREEFAKTARHRYATQSNQKSSDEIANVEIDNVSVLDKLLFRASLPSVQKTPELFAYVLTVAWKAVRNCLPESKQNFRIENLAWTGPDTLSGTRPVLNIEIDPMDESKLGFDITETSSSSPICQGSILIVEDAPDLSLGEAPALKLTEQAVGAPFADKLQKYILIALEQLVRQLEPENTAETIVPAGIASVFVANTTEAVEDVYLHIVREVDVCDLITSDFNVQSHLPIFSDTFNISFSDGKGKLLARFNGIQFVYQTSQAEDDSVPDWDALFRQPYAYRDIRQNADPASTKAKPADIVLSAANELNFSFAKTTSEKPKLILSQTKSFCSSNELQTFSVTDFGQGIVCINTVDTSITVEELCSSMVALVEAINRDTTIKVIIFRDTEQLIFNASERLQSAKEDVIASGLLNCFLMFAPPVIAVLDQDASNHGLLAACHCDYVFLAGEKRYFVDNNLMLIGEKDSEIALFRQRFAGATETLFNGADGFTLQALGATINVTSVAQQANEVMQLAVLLADKPANSLRLLTNHFRSGIRALSSRLREALSHWHVTDTTTRDQRAWLAMLPNGNAMTSTLIQKAITNTKPMADATRVINSPHLQLDEFENGVVLIHITDEASKNAFTPNFIESMNTAFEYAASSPSSKVAVLTGFDQYFSLGGTKQGLLDIQAGRARYSDAPLYELPLFCDIPVIAAMQGHAIGAGWALGMFCDFQVLSKESIYTTRFMQYGFTPGFGSTLAFPRHLGIDLSRKLLMGAAQYRGGDLKAMAPHLAVVTRNEVLSTALKLANTLAQEPGDKLKEEKLKQVTSLRAVLTQVVEQEQEMHAQTFFDNEEALNRISSSFEDIENDTHIVQDQTGEGKTNQAENARNLLPQVVSHLRRTLAVELDLTEDNIDGRTPFIDLGLDSISGVTWVRNINDHYRLSVIATKVYNHPTLDEFAQFILEQCIEAGYFENQLPGNPDTPQASQDQLIKHLQKTLAEELDLPVADIPTNTPFIELGLDSISGVTWIRKINSDFGLNINATKVYSYPTISEFAELIKEMGCTPFPATETVFEHKVNNVIQFPGTETQKHVQPAKGDRPTRLYCFPRLTAKPLNIKGSLARRLGKTNTDIAVIGIAGQYPKAKDLDSFWHNLVNGINCVEEVPATRWDWESYYAEDLDAPGKTHCKWMGALTGIDQFDPLFFNISPMEARIMDPQQRLFLQKAWHCIESAGYTPQKLSGKKCGVFAGSAVGDYGQLVKDTRLSLAGLMGDTSSMLAARISYILNLQGPCISIDTACSSSLVAIASACDSLILGSSDMALAGGAYVMSTPDMHITTTKARMLSQTGRCYTFDQRADGFVPGEGVGVLMLKRLQDAEREGDPIHAVIRGWGVNQDGKTNGITAPNPDSQTRLMTNIYERFGIDPADISLIEAHGTGTKLGDPIEIEGLKQTFKSCEHKHTCALGSVKSNIGHALTAAGVAGISKLILALKHQVIPPTINFDQLNEHIALEQSPFYINTTAKSWASDNGKPRLAAVSSFGFSGTNAHIVIGEYNGKASSRNIVDFPDSTWLSTVFPISAKTATQLRAQAENLCAWLKKNDVNLACLAYTLQTGREAFEHRIIIEATNRNDLIGALANFIDQQVSLKHIVSKSAEQLSDNNDARKYIQAWLAGNDVDWSALYANKKPGVIDIPGYAFADKRYWIADSACSVDTNNNKGETVLYLPGECLEIADEENLVCYEIVITDTNHALFRDYQLNGKPVLSASFYVSLCMSAVQKAFYESGKSHFVLENIEFIGTRILHGFPLRIQTKLKRESNQCWQISIASKSVEEAQWHLCARAKIDPSKTSMSIQLKPDEPENTKRLDIASFYKQCATQGLAYGKAWRSIKTVAVNENRGLMEMENAFLTNESTHQNELRVMHPGSMDSFFQVISFCFWEACKQGYILVPEKIVELRWKSSTYNCERAKFRLYRSDKQYSGDFAVSCDQGATSMEIAGVTLIEHKAVATAFDEPAVISEEPAFLPLTQLLGLDDDHMLAAVKQGFSALLESLIQVDVEKDFVDASEFFNSHFTALGLDSVLAQKLRKDVQAQLHVTLPLEKILGGSRVIDAVDYVLQQLTLRMLTGEGGTSEDSETETLTF